eukprot:TRINITY_DN7175_c0_g1_i1.p1 TRINITY_DN7175_c0_g1~~TRINITY_DN7175_c0_g1_i1.p1  ORF type:complete len:311 (-),score=67.97 TRINITY_DN7175_c0_g1_i1:72-1004(-)
MFLVRAQKSFRKVSTRKYSTPNSEHLLKLSLKEVIEKLKNGETTSAELTEACLSRIESHKQYNSFVSVVDKNRLMERANEIDKERQKNGNSLGLLHGVPIAVKDNFNVKGTVTSCSSKMLKDYVSPFSAHVCEKIEQQNGIIIGKTNMDEFGMGSLSTFSEFGPVVNPHSTSDKLSAGGSSGGSAVAVSDDQCYGSLGSDTGGSVRLPAAWCGIVGLKPSYGRCSRYGLVSYASSLDTPAIFGKTVEDTAILLSAIAGYDPRDSTSLNKPVDDYLGAVHKVAGSNLNGIRIGIPVVCCLQECWIRDDGNL